MESCCSDITNKSLLLFQIWDLRTFGGESGRNKRFFGGLSCSFVLFVHVEEELMKKTIPLVIGVGVLAFGLGWWMRKPPLPEVVFVTKDKTPASQLPRIQQQSPTQQTSAPIPRVTSSVSITKTKPAVKVQTFVLKGTPPLRLATSDTPAGHVLKRTLLQSNRRFRKCLRKHALNSTATQLQLKAQVKNGRWRVYGIGKKKNPLFFCLGFSLRKTTIPSSLSGKFVSLILSAPRGLDQLKSSVKLKKLAKGTYDPVVKSLIQAKAGFFRSVTSNSCIRFKIKDVSHLGTSQWKRKHYKTLELVHEKEEKLGGRDRNVRETILRLEIPSHYIELDDITVIQQPRLLKEYRNGRLKRVEKDGYCKQREWLYSSGKHDTYRLHLGSGNLFVKKKHCQVFKNPTSPKRTLFLMDEDVCLYPREEPVKKTK